MENIIMLVKGAAVLALIVVGIVALLFPVLLDSSFKQNTGKGCINYWLTAAEAVCLLAMCGYRWDTASDGFYEAVGFLVVFIVVSIISARKKAKKWNLDKGYTFLVTAAQVLSPLSVFFILIMIASVLKGEDEENGKKH